MADPGTSADLPNLVDTANPGNPATSADLTASKDPADLTYATLEASENEEDPEDPSTKARAETRRALSSFKDDGTPDYSARMTAYEKTKAAYYTWWDAQPPEPKKPPSKDYYYNPIWPSLTAEDFKPRPAVHHKPKPPPPKMHGGEFAKFYEPAKNWPPGSSSSGEVWPELTREWMQTEAGKAFEAKVEAEFGTPQEQRDRINKAIDDVLAYRKMQAEDPKFAPYREAIKNRRVDGTDMIRKWHASVGYNWDEHHLKPDYWQTFPREYQKIVWEKEAEKEAKAAAEKAEAEQKGKAKTGKGKGKK